MVSPKMLNSGSQQGQGRPRRSVVRRLQLGTGTPPKTSTRVQLQVQVVKVPGFRRCTDEERDARATAVAWLAQKRLDAAQAAGEVAAAADRGPQPAVAPAPSAVDTLTGAAHLAASVHLAGDGAHKLAGPGPETEEDSSDEEDTSDAAFAARHAPWEQEERNQFELVGAGVPRAAQKQKAASGAAPLICPAPKKSFSRAAPTKRPLASGPAGVAAPKMRQLGTEAHKPYRSTSTHLKRQLLSTASDPVRRAERQKPRTAAHAQSPAAEAGASRRGGDGARMPRPMAARNSSSSPGRVPGSCRGAKAPRNRSALGLATSGGMKCSIGRTSAEVDGCTITTAAAADIELAPNPGARNTSFQHPAAAHVSFGPPSGAAAGFRWPPLAPGSLAAAPVPGARSAESTEQFISYVDSWIKSVRPLVSGPTSGAASLSPWKQQASAPAAGDLWTAGSSAGWWTTAVMQHTLIQRIAGREGVGEEQGSASQACLQALHSGQAASVASPPPVQVGTGDKFPVFPAEFQAAAPAAAVALAPAAPAAVAAPSSAAVIAVTTVVKAGSETVASRTQISSDRNGLELGAACVVELSSGHTRLSVGHLKAAAAAAAAEGTKLCVGHPKSAAAAEGIKLAVEHLRSETPATTATALPPLALDLTSLLGKTSSGITEPVPMEGCDVPLSPAELPATDLEDTGSGSSAAAQHAAAAAAAATHLADAMRELPLAPLI